MLRIEFDPAKDKLNRALHGIPLSFANTLVWDEAIVWVDDRFRYDEVRMVGLVPAGDRLYYVAFVDRAGSRRIISLRFAVRREIDYYVKTYP